MKPKIPGTSRRNIARLAYLRSKQSHSESGKLHPTALCPAWLAIPVIGQIARKLARLLSATGFALVRLAARLQPAVVNPPRSISPTPPLEHLRNLPGFSRPETNTDVNH